jgi:hypothetical protein
MKGLWFKSSNSTEVYHPLLVQLDERASILVINNGQLGFNIFGNIVFECYTLRFLALCNKGLPGINVFLPSWLFG